MDSNNSNSHYTAHKKLSHLKKTADVVTFTEENLNGKRHFLCSVSGQKDQVQLGPPR